MSFRGSSLVGSGRDRDLALTSTSEETQDNWQHFIHIRCFLMRSGT